VTVTVQRVDELIEDTDGDVLAARIVDMSFSFDVDPSLDDPTVLVNNVPVELGVSQVQVMTMVVASKQLSDLLPPEIVNSLFDVGLALVDVDVTAEKLLLVRKDLVADPGDALPPLMDDAPDFLEVRRVTIRVNVVEVNGVKVEQMQLVETVMDVLATGYVVRGPPTTIPASSDPDEMAAMEARREAHRQHCMQHQRMAALWQRLPRGTRIAIAGFFGSLLVLVFFVALPLAAYVHWKERKEGYARVGMVEAQEGRLPTINEEDEEDAADAPAVATDLRQVDEKAWLRANDASV